MRVPLLLGRHSAACKSHGDRKARREACRGLPCFGGPSSLETSTPSLHSSGTRVQEGTRVSLPSMIDRPALAQDPSHGCSCKAVRPTWYVPVTLYRLLVTLLARRGGQCHSCPGEKDPPQNQQSHPSC